MENKPIVFGVAGGTASGKTTAITKSGLNFPVGMAGRPDDYVGDPFTDPSLTLAGTWPPRRLTVTALARSR